MVALVTLKSALALRADDSAFSSKLYLQTQIVVSVMFLETIYTNVMKL